MNLSEQLRYDALQFVTRRHFLRTCSTGLGAMWLATQAGHAANASVAADGGAAIGSVAPHFAARAKRVIFLHMAGGPSQLELFDFKPVLKQLDGKDCPQ